MVALAGQVASSVAGREAFQESDLVGGIGSLASWAGQIDHAADAPNVLGRAWRRLSTGRPGPVLLSVPVDVQSEVVELLDEPPPTLPGARGPAADRSTVSRALKMLAASERGVIVAGAGVLRGRATKRLVALSEALAVPVIAAWRRPDVFPNDHANYLGMAGSWAAPTVHQRLADADVILFVGHAALRDHHWRLRHPRSRHALDPRRRAASCRSRWAGRAHPCDRRRMPRDSSTRPGPTCARPRSTTRCAAGVRHATLPTARPTERPATWLQGSGLVPGAHPGRILAILRAALPDNATITTDAGNLAGFVARGFLFRRAGTFLGATSGTMGFGLPAAIAASLMEPDRIAVALCGDGGFAMTMNELETAVREDAHPIAVVFDNERYGTIAGQQLKDGRDTRSTDLGPVDFAAVARAHGALGFTVEDEAAFESALREAITSRQASVIHVKVDRAWLSADEHPFSAS